MVQTLTWRIKMTTNSRNIPVWLYGMMIIPYGAATGFTSTTLPYLLRQAGLEVEAIGWYTAAALIPSFTQFLYAPLLDVGMRRKHWLLLFATLGALCMGIALWLPLPQKANAVLALVFLGQVFFGMVSSCCGGLMATTIPDPDRGRAAGFYNAGILGGMGLMVAVTLLPWMQKVPQLLFLFVVLLLWVPCLLGFLVPEEKGAKKSAKKAFSSLFRDLWRTLKSRSGWMGILFCLSPVGSVALTNCFGSIAKDYHATQGMVAFANGAVSSLVTILGSLLGGYVCDRFPRRKVYIFSGLLTSLTGFIFLVGPLSPNFYLMGVASYLFVAGFVYAAFSAVVLETIGKEGDAASTKYALFNATGNFAVTYVGVLDTRFHHAFGPRALWGTDAILNLVGALFLVVLTRIGWRRMLTVTVLNPGGNITALISEEVPRIDQPGIAQRIMKRDPTIEQVGFIERPTSSEAQVRLQMMGGEFCANGARAIAHWWCQQNQRNSMILEISGFSGLVTASITPNHATITLPKSFVHELRMVEEGAVVSLAGIRHIVVMDPLFRGNEKALIEAYGDEQPAVGVMHVHRIADEINLTPIVWVCSTNTLVAETACASGSIAVAMGSDGRKQTYQVKQPSGAVYEIDFSIYGTISLSGPMTILGQKVMVV